MKRISKVIFAALTVFAAISCNKEVAGENPQPVNPDAKQYVIKAYASDAIVIDGTKTSISDSYKPLWQVGDKISVWNGTEWATSDALGEDDIEDEGNKANFTVTVTEADLYIVVSPASAVDKDSSPSGNTVNVKIPSTQAIASDGCIASDAIIQVAQTADLEGDMTLKNATSLLKFSIPVEGVNKVEFSSKDGSEGVTGAVAVTVGDEVTTAPSGTSGLTISKADGFTKDATYYATVFNKSVEGIKFKFTAEEYKSIVTSSRAISFVQDGGVNFTIPATKIESGKFPLKISTKDDLEKFAANSAQYEVGEWVTLCADIDYDATWTAVADFEGNFDGGNHSIYGSTNGLTFQANSAYPQFIGFFSKIYAEVKDLKLGYNPATTEADGNSTLSYTDKVIAYAGPLAGTAASRSGVGPVNITNVQNYVKHSVLYAQADPDSTFLRAGNIVGNISCDNAQITSCTNYVEVTNRSTIADCVGDQYLGGLVGVVAAANVTISDCNNYGQVLPCVGALVSSKNYFCGGIVGRLAGGSTNMKFIRCKNYAAKVASSKNVKKQIFLGGILGADNTGADVTMENCVNESPYLKLGSQSNNCASGGMIGYAKSEVFLEGCVNGIETYVDSCKMVITGNNLTYAGYGGIIGYASGASGVIRGCTNYGSQTVETAFSKACPKGFGRGGIVGLITGSSTLSLENCKNYGAINMGYSVTKGFTSGAGIGGIIGSNLSESTISNCENYGTITETGKTVTGAGAGGLIGYQTAISQTGAGCKVDCTVTSVSNGGMIVGNNVVTAVYGTDASKIKVCGTFKGKTLNATNYTTYLYAGAGTATCNAEFWVK